MVAGAFFPAGERGPEPGVLVGGVVGHDVHDHPQAQPVGLVHQGLCVGEIAEERVDHPVVGHVIAAVRLGRAVEGGEPDGVDAQLGEVGKPGPGAGQITDAVAVAVGEGAHVHLVDDGVPPPVRGAGDGLVRAGASEFLGHGRSLVRMGTASQLPWWPTRTGDAFPHRRVNAPLRSRMRQDRLPSGSSAGRAYGAFSAVECGCEPVPTPVHPVPEGGGKPGGEGVPLYEGASGEDQYPARSRPRPLACSLPAGGR